MALGTWILALRSGKGDCYDNGSAGSFCHRFKSEAIHSETVITRTQMRAGDGPASYASRVAGRRCEPQG